MRWIEITIALSVVVISVASLFVAVFQGHVMQRQLEASVLPILSYNHGNYDDEREEARITLTLGNRGLGPAEIQRVSLHYGGQSYRNIHELIMACCQDTAHQTQDAQHAAWQSLIREGGLFITTSTLTNALLSPGDEVNFVTIARPETEVAQAVWSRLDHARWELDMSVCYCSVFDQCWQTEFPENTRTSVRSCDADFE